MIRNECLNHDISSMTSARTTSFCHAPLSHSSRLNLMRTLSDGGRVGISLGIEGDMFEDVRLLQPTSLSFVPRYEEFSGFDSVRIWEMIYQKFKKSVEKRKLSDTASSRDEIEVGIIIYFLIIPSDQCIKEVRT